MNYSEKLGEEEYKNSDINENITNFEENQNNSINNNNTNDNIKKKNRTLKYYKFLFY